MSLLRIAVALCSALACALAAGCARERPAPARGPMGLAVDVRADTSDRVTLHVAPPAARVWVSNVSPTRLVPAPPSPVPPAPAAEPDTARLVEAADPPPALAVDEGLKPPLLRVAAPLTVPPGTGRARVELDVNVDEEGRVTDVEWADGTRDSALVRAARRCAYAMRFFPAERAGRPVAVWCRQRFEFGGAADAPAVAPPVRKR